ncbi:MAG: hypothetical protein ACJ708_07025 [Nitrososphaeraceae archaeon]
MKTPEMINRNLNTDQLKDILIVFPSSFSVNKKDELKAIINKKLQLSHVKVSKIVNEEACIVFEATDVVEAAAITSEMFGIDKVAIAKRIENRFNDVVNAIVNTGKQIILPGEKFFVKVYTSNSAKKISYVGRDIEFASVGNLITELLPKTVTPAKNESEADKIILAYVGKDSAYVCIQIDKALGGLPFGYQNEKVICSIHNILSFISCMLAVKCGFIPELFILYTNEYDLKENAKLFGHMADKMDVKKYTIRLLHIDIPDRYDTHIKFMLQESISARILTLLPGKRIVVPLSAAIHPPWFVEAVMKKIIHAGKASWMPLMLLTTGIYHEAISMGLKDKIILIDLLINNMTFTKLEYKKYESLIDTLSKVAIKNMKTISLNVGPNYLHDIIDSI